MPPKFDPSEVKLGKWKMWEEFLCKNQHPYGFGYVAILRVHKNEHAPILLCICRCVVYLRAVGGEVGATSSLAPKIGPLGLVSVTFNFFSLWCQTKKKKSFTWWYRHVCDMCDFSIFQFFCISFHSHRRKSVMTSLRQPVTGKAWKSLYAWPSKTDKPPSVSFHRPLHWSSKHWRNHHVTERRSRTVSWLIS